MRGADVPSPPILLGPAGPPPLAGEPAALASLAGAGVPLAPASWVPETAESDFYRWNALPARLSALFEGIASHDPDEDEVEDAAAEARALVSAHALLDVWVDAFYDALADLPPRVRVRRPGAPGRVVARGRPALLAVRAVWSHAWSDEVVLARLRATGAALPAPAPVLIQDAADLPAPAALRPRVGSVLGEEVPVRADGDGRVTRVGSAARPEPRDGRG